MAILRRISSLFAFKATEPAPEIPSSPTVVDSHHRDNLQERPVFIERPTHIPKSVFLSPPAEKITLDSFLKDRQSLSPGTKVRGYLLSTAVEEMVRPKKRSLDSDDTASSIERTMKKTKIADDTTTGSIERRMKKAKIVDETESEDDLDGTTMIDIVGEVQDDEAEDDETTDEQDEGVDMEWQEGDEADATLADQADTSSPFKLPLYPASQQHNFRSIGVGESATTAKAFNSIDIKNKRTLNVPASPTTTDMFVDSDTLLSAGWPDDTLVLIQKLHHRGREPILPSHWSMDFHFLPDALFTSISADNTETAFVRALCYGSKRDFHATKALQTLFQLSSRVRDKVHARMAPESLIEKGFQAFIAWAYNDGGLAVPIQPALPGKGRSVLAGAAVDAEPPLPPLILTHTAPRTLDSKTLEKGVLTRLINLRQDWINYIASYPTSAAPEGYLREREEPPTIYAVVVSHTNVAMVAFSGQALRQIGHFDFGVMEFDVWNAIALAVLAVHARNIAGAVWEEYEGDDFVESIDDMDVEEAPEDDPDA